jgi:hypothetical protein
MGSNSGVTRMNLFTTRETYPATPRFCIRPGTVPMLAIVIAIIAAASISIFLVHAVEAYLTQ